MSETKIRATQKNIEAYKAKYPDANDEHLKALVASSYPNVFEDDAYLAYHIMLDFVRHDLVYSDTAFVNELKRRVDNGDFDGWTKEFNKLTNGQFKTDKLVDYIYKTAPKRTLYLSECKDFIDDEVIAFLNEEMNRTERTLAQVFFSMLNIKAQKELNDFGPDNWYKLSFHCYVEPTGDVVFTKNKRSLECWDSLGNPIVSEKDIEQGNLPQSSSATLCSKVPSDDLTKVEGFSNKTKIIIFCAVMVPIILFILLLIFR